MTDTTTDPGTADNPTPLRWGLNDVMWGDDDTITVLLSGPAGEPYWLELAPERAAVLRADLAGPEGVEEIASAVLPATTDRAACQWPVCMPEAQQQALTAAVQREMRPPTDQAAKHSSGREAEAELYVLLRKAGEDRYEAQALINRHRDEVLRRVAAEEQPATEEQQ